MVRTLQVFILSLVTLPVAAQQADTNGVCPIERLDHLAAFDIPMGRGEVVFAPWTLPVEPSGSFRRTALAHVFASDPLGGDAIEVTLEGLLGDGLFLDGDFVRAGSDQLDGAGNAAAAVNGDFRFAADTTGTINCPTDQSECPAFDAVNVYYHVDSFARHFWEGEMDVDIAFRAQARVHIGGDGAFADWNTHSLKFGVGDIFMKNSALSDDLIYHEYTHLVLASLGFEAGAGVSEETRALHEAYADYFTATWTDDPHIGEWVVTCPPRQQCEGPPNSTDLRTLILDREEWNWRQGQPSDDLKYGICTRFHEGDLKCKQSWNNFTNPYIWGMIWASALWDLRATIGPEMADRIALEAARQHTSESGFEQAHSQIVETGHALFGPNVGDQVRMAFEQRGFDLVTDVEQWESGPGGRDGLDVVLWPNPASNMIRIRADGSGVDTGGKWSIVDALGRPVLQGRMDTGYALAEGADWSVEISDLPPGLYLIRIRVNGMTRTKPFLKVR